MTLEQHANRLNGAYGVYLIRNVKKRKAFIGKADDIGKDINAHLEALRKNRHTNAVMQVDFINSKGEGWEVKALERLKHGDTKNRYSFYRQWIDDYCSKNPEYGYNGNAPRQQPKYDGEIIVTPEDRAHNYRVIAEMKAAREKRIRKGVIK